MSLLHHRDFVRLWAAQAVSAVGSRITRTALPIIAVTSLDVPASAVGALMAVQYAPGVVLAVIAGGFVDRSRKRRVLVAADAIRAVLVASIAVAWWADALTMAHVIVVGAGVGAMTALFVIADKAYLPILVGSEQLGEGNAKIETTEAIAEITGPAAGGGLIGAIGAPLAMLVDAATYVWSALFLGAIRHREPAAPPRSEATRSTVRSDLATGMRALLDHRPLRLMLIALSIWSVSGGFFMALYTPYCLRVLELDTATLGILIGFGGVGGLLGAFFANRMARRWGIGRTLVVAATISLLAQLLIPLARGPAALVIACLVAHQLISDMLAVVFMIHAVTVRQTALPRDVLGRANAAMHVCTAGLMTIAAVAAGLLADAVGTRDAIWIGMIVGLAAPIAVWPLRDQRDLVGTPRVSDR